MSTEAKKRKGLKLLLWAAIILAAVLIGAVITWLWLTRSITPVELTAEEIEVVEKKINPVIDSIEKNEYVDISSITITQRELNGLLHHKSNWGDKLQFHLNPDQITATINLKIPDESPIWAGKKMRGEIECVVSVENDEPAVIITSIRALGTSYPEKLLDDYMDRNLISDIKDALGIDYSLSAIGSIEVKKGELVIELNDKR